MANKLQVTLTRSVIGRPQDQRETVKALGLRKINQTGRAYLLCRKAKLDAG